MLATEAIHEPRPTTPAACRPEYAQHPHHGSPMSHVPPSAVSVCEVRMPSSRWSELESGGSSVMPSWPWCQDTVRPRELLSVFLTSPVVVSWVAAHSSKGEPWRVAMQRVLYRSWRLASSLPSGSSSIKCHTFLRRAMSQSVQA